MSIVRCYLGEICIATIRGQNGYWTIESNKAICCQVIEANVYGTFDNAFHCVEMLVPWQCRPLIRQALVYGERPVF